MKTEITELLGIEYPVIQGGMAWVAECHLAAAVSNAGGLGLIAAGGAPAEWVREQIRALQKVRYFYQIFCRKASPIKFVLQRLWGNSKISGKFDVLFSFDGKQRFDLFRNCHVVTFFHLFFDYMITWKKSLVKQNIIKNI